MAPWVSTDPLSMALTWHFVAEPPCTSLGITSFAVLINIFFLVYFLFICISVREVISNSIFASIGAMLPVTSFF